MAKNAEMELTERILSELKKIQDPDLGKDIVSLDFVKDIILKKTLLGAYDISVTIELTTPACPIKDEFKQQALQLLSNIENVKQVTIKMTAQVASGSAKNTRSIHGVKNIIAVGSGKGGVGKSTVALNIAFALKKMGSHVGLLDADIHGPSLAMMLGLKGGMPEVRNSRIIPKFVHGIPAMTFAFFAPIGEAVIWRGAMTGKAVEQMLYDVDWSFAEENLMSAKNSPSETPRKELDYLIVDMPPGTGDIPITMIHAVNIDGAVVVSTPQAVAWLDAAKGIAMYEKMNVPVLGVVENMSGYFCQHCHKENNIFGSGGAEAQALNKGVSFLGRIPLEPSLVISADAGKPFVYEHPDHPATKSFFDIAQKIAHQLSLHHHKKSIEPSAPQTKVT